MIIRQVAHFASHDYWQQPCAERLADDAVISIRARQAQTPPAIHGLSLKLVTGGDERFSLLGRSLRLDDDAYLLLDEAHSCSSRIHSERFVESLQVFFSPALVSGTLSRRLGQHDRLLGDSGSGGIHFVTQLHPHDRLVTPVLRYIGRIAATGHDDPVWYRDHLELLLCRLLQHHRMIVQRIVALPGLKLATRIETYRRIARARDYLWSNYDRALSIRDIAEAACLSVSQLHAHFKAVYDCSPVQCLQRKRICVAQRLLGGHTALADVAARVGLESRSTFFRTFRRVTGMSPCDYRRHAPSAASPDAALRAASTAPEPR